MESQVTHWNQYKVLHLDTYAAKIMWGLTSDFFHPHAFAELLVLRILRPLQNNGCCILLGFIPLLYVLIVNRMPCSTSLWRITSVSFWVWKLLCRCSIKKLEFPVTNSRWSCCCFRIESTHAVKWVRSPKSILSVRDYYDWREPCICSK